MITVKTHNGYERIAIPDIAYLSHADKYTSIHHIKDGVIKEAITEQSLISLSEEFPEFTKVHKNLAVRLGDITSRTCAKGETQNYITLCTTGDLKLPISRRSIPTVNEELRK